jgi:hypothetical protein
VVLTLVDSDVIYKLLAFTAAMAVGPIGIYFLTVNTIFRGSYSSKMTALFPLEWKIN